MIGDKTIAFTGTRLEIARLRAFIRANRAELKEITGEVLLALHNERIREFRDRVKAITDTYNTL